MVAFAKAGNENTPEQGDKSHNGVGDCRFYEYTPAQRVRCSVFCRCISATDVQIFAFGRILNVFDANRKVKDPNQSEAIRGTIHAQAFSYDRSVVSDGSNIGGRECR
jgi:hypothetical protein